MIIRNVRERCLQNGFKFHNRQIMRVLFLAVLFLVQSVGHAKYTFGENQQWVVSGYSNLKFKATHHNPSELELDDFSLFLSANINKWINPFMEIEFFSIPIWESGDGIQLDRAEFIIERMYNDFKINNENSIRLGKFLSPLNRWNLIHAAPLVWTVNRPTSTRYSFANFITGIKYRYNLDLFDGQAIDLYWQPYKEFYPKPLRKQGRDYQSVVGATWTLKDNMDRYYAFTMQHDNVKNSSETRTTGSFDFFLQETHFELEGQLLFTYVDNDIKESRNYDWGGYFQVAIPIPFDLNIIARYEHFEFSNRAEASDIALAGITFRPRPDISLKLEWQQTWGDTWHADTGLHGSFSVLF
jgi:hypothetical protein